MNNSPRKDQLKYLLTNVVVLIIISFAVLCIGIYMQMQLNQAKRLEIKHNEENIVSLEKKIIINNLRGLFSDVEYLGYTLRSFDIKQAEGGYRQLEENWTFFLDSKEIFNKLILLSKDGYKMVRIDYNPMGSFAQNFTNAQTAKSTDSFFNSIDLHSNRLTLSRFDLNIENGKLETPPKPTIRLAKVVTDINSRLKGIIVLYYNAARMLEDFEQSSLTSYGEVYLLNNDGYWLYHGKDQRKEWGFMYPGKESVSFSAEFPAEWASITKTEQGAIVTENGLFTFAQVDPSSAYFDGGHPVLDKPIVSDDEKWIVVSYVPSESEIGFVFKRDLHSILLYTLEKQRLTILIILLFSALTEVLFAVSRHRGEKIKHFSRDVLTDVYSRSAGLELLQKVYRKSSKKKQDMSICFIDVNGLKGVNDTMGHIIGDELIRTVTDVLKRNIRESDFIMRYGGDEFLIVLPNANREQAESIWQRILFDYETINRRGHSRFFISVSHGIEEFQYDRHETIEGVIRSADDKMYEEKKTHNTDEQF